MELIERILNLATAIISLVAAIIAYRATKQDKG